MIDKFKVRIKSYYKQKHKTGSLNLCPAKGTHKDVKIPKIIHFFWTGPNFSYMDYIAVKSAKKFNPSYEINLWYDNAGITKWWKKIEKICKLKSAKDLINHEFTCMVRLSEFIRLSVLYKYGGIYLDTDTITLRSLDYLLNYNFWAGYQDDKLINIAIIGCVPKHDIVKRSLKRFMMGGEWEAILKILTDIIHSNNYKNIFLFKPAELYCIGYMEWNKFLTESIVPDVPVLHYWSKMSRHVTKCIDQGYDLDNIIGNAIKSILS